MKTAMVRSATVSALSLDSSSQCGRRLAAQTRIPVAPVAAVAAEAQHVAHMD